MNGICNLTKRYPYQIRVFYIIFLAVLISTPGLATDSIQFEVQSGDYQITADTLKSAVIRIDGFYTNGSPGKPRLPSKYYDIALPPDVDFNSIVISLKQIEEDEIEVPFEIEPAPPVCELNKKAEHHPLWGDAKWIEDGKDMTVYSRNQFFPAQNVSIAAYSQMRKWKYIRVVFSPLRYNPKTNRIKHVKNARISVQCERTGEKISSDLLCDTLMDDLAGERFVNFQQARNWYKTPDGFKDTRAIYDYVIVTTNHIESTSSRLGTFVDHKADIGYSVLVVTEDEYGSVTAPPPNRVEDKIRQWLKDHYAAYGIEYVLLIGDPREDQNDIPMKMCRVPGISTHRQRPLTGISLT